MQREIKFRVFDPTEKYMSKGSTLKDACLKAKTADFYWDDEVVIMQYTGLKDKNGKEIYEGDIITNNTIQTHGLPPFEVYWDEEGVCFRAKRLVEIGEYHVKNLSALPVDIYTSIGNIYENPELLQP